MVLFRFLACLTLIAALAPAAPVRADGAHSPRGSVLPGHPDVIGEYMRVPGAQAVGTPSELNVVNFLRVRRNTPGLHQLKADAVVIAQPGFSGTPGTWLELAAQLVEKAGERQCGAGEGAPQRCNVEVWVIDRRGSNLEDTAGLRNARVVGDPSVGLGYYYGPFILTPKGTVPLPPGGDYNALLGLPGATFQPLVQDDVPFMSEWGFETAADDIEALIALLDPQGEGRRNVFIAGHSQGGGYVSYFAGRRFDYERRGHEVAAGLIFLDGGPSSGSSPAPTQAEIDDYLSAVDDIRTGVAPRFGASIGGVAISTGLGVQAAVVGLYNEATPGAESIFAPAVQPAHPGSFCFVFGFHLPDFVCGGVGLRLTYRALAGFNFDDDPVPGAFTQTPIITVLGHRSGHLDFTPLPGTEGTCVAPGPFDLVPPCPPPNAQIDPNVVYDWLDGGGNGPAGPDGPLNGWTTFDGGASFVPFWLNPLPNPSKVASFMNNGGFAPARTNVVPVALDFPVSGAQTIDAGEMNPFNWYQATRYDMDSGFVGSFQTLQLDQDGVSFDVDKTTIATPIYAAARGAPTNPFPLVDDSTLIGSFGTTQSPVAAALSPIDPATNSAHYGHVDFITADDSLAGSVSAGFPGASLVSNTLIDWVLARKEGRTHTPNSNSLGVRKVR